jgi:hypothetical protein
MEKQNVASSSVETFTTLKNEGPKEDFDKKILCPLG